MAKRPEVSIKLTAVDKTAQAFKSVNRSLGAVRKSLLNFKTGIATAVGAGGLGLMVKASLDATDALAKTANRIGVTTQELQKLHHAATITGVETATMNMALQRFIRRTAEAAQGTGEAKAALKELGLNASQLTKLPLEEQMLALADAFAGAGTDADRVRLAMKLFDSEGVALVQTLKEGRSGLKGMFEDAETLGMVLSTSAVKGVEAANDSMARLVGVGKGFRDQVVAALAPGLEALTTHFTNLIVEQSAAKGGFEALAKAVAVDLIEGMKTAVLAGVNFFNFFIESINTTAQAWANFKNMFTLDERSGAQVLLQNYEKNLADLYAELEKAPDKADGLFGFLTRTKADVQANIDALEAEMARLRQIAKPEDGGNLIDLIPTDGLTAAFDALLEGLAKSKDAVNEVTEPAVAAVAKMPSLFQQMGMAAGLAFEDIAEGFGSIGERGKKMEADFKSLAESGIDSLTNGLAAAVEGTKSLKDAFADMARGIVQDLTKMLIKYYLVQPLFNAITGAFPTGPSPAPSSPPTQNAIGGPVHRGKMHLVGERGPELFVPSRSGSIVPNDKLGGGSVIVQQTINVTTGVQQTVRAEIANLMPQIQAAAKAAVAESRMRGGAYSRAMVGA